MLNVITDSLDTLQLKLLL